MLRVIVIALFLAAAVFAVVGLGTMLLWNWLAVGMFGAPHVSFPQAAGLVVAFIFLRNLLRVRVKISR